VSCSIFLLGVQGEGVAGVPGKLANLMASGRPIIATVNPKGDAAKIIEEAKCGYCIEPGDSQKLAEAVLTLCRDRELREKMGKRHGNMPKKFFTYNLCKKI